MWKALARYMVCMYKHTYSTSTHAYIHIIYMYVCMRACHKTAGQHGQPQNTLSVFTRVLLSCHMSILSTDWRISYDLSYIISLIMSYAISYQSHVTYHMYPISQYVLLYDMI